MKRINEKTPLLGEGKARVAMEQFIAQIKRNRGLTSFIQQNGINGQWLQQDKPYDIRFSKLHKIMCIAAQYRETDEEFLEKWNQLGKDLLKEIK